MLRTQGFRIKMRVAILVGVLLLLPVSSHFLWSYASGATYYVSPSGIDTNPGTETQPWQTIQKAADTLVAGDTVYIKAGTYPEKVIPLNSGNAGNYINYAAYPGDTVTIDGAGIQLASYLDGLIYLTEISYIKISGLKITNAGPNINNCGILLEDASYITIENNHTYNTVSSGIGVWDCNNIILDGNEVELACNDGEQECISVSGTDTFEIMNNHVHDSGPGTIGGEGICPKDGSFNGKVYNNHVHDLNNRLGIYIDAWDKHTYDIEVYSNIVHDMKKADGFTVASETGGLLENIKIYNNLSYNNGVNGLTISVNGEPLSKHPMKGIYVVNNTFYNNGVDWGGGIVMENTEAEDIVIRNNILSQNNTFQALEEIPDNNFTMDHNLIDGFRDYESEIYGDDYITGDPLFVSTSEPDFHLQENSPAIDKGSSTDAPGDDYEGTARPQGLGYDIGAFEYGSGTVTTTTGPITTTTILSTTTTTTEGACPSEEIYGEDSEETQLLRYFRDNVLNQTPEGQELIRLYYLWSPAIVRTMEEDEEFKEDVKEMTDGVLELMGRVQ